MNTDSLNAWNSGSTAKVVNVLLAIDNEQDMKNFLSDLMTKKEIMEVGSRLEAATMLSAGSTYVDIGKKTKLSTRTIARISEWMKNGCGGYEIAIQKLSKDHNPHI